MKKQKRHLHALGMCSGVYNLILPHAETAGAEPAFLQCLTWLALPMVTQSFSSPCCKDTHSRPGQAPREGALARRKGAKHGCNSLRQEAGTVRSSWTPESPQRSAHSALYTKEHHWVANLRQPLLETQERANTLMPLLWGTFSGNHWQEPRLPCVSHRSVGSPLHLLHNTQLLTEYSLIFKTQF